MLRLVLVALLLAPARGFQIPLTLVPLEKGGSLRTKADLLPAFGSIPFDRRQRRVTTKLSVKMGKNYEPKWKKKSTLADDSGSLSPQDKGITGDITVIFKQGNATKSTMAMPGQPVSFIAAQAGQYIKYGCKKGECGTCEALCDGKWIRPCTETVPELEKGSEYIVQLKELKSKAASSGKFYSFRSFIMGFYNNALGMVGFVKRRRAAKKNWEERQDMEELVRQKTLEKRRAREQASTNQRMP